ncbi:tyrosine recombinase XerC [Acuticoccus sp. I52.16.1]|uniref:tyrosine recombinase XerC n=1 Tax=Acuticoccus sp. I52.16.1 TaxID=2928472 RepID=UPI001FD1928E|nr:tyrosine recombinase XerC [Acuticoccus sp. I52.16.1]UOM36039.1 tyrosine recombinase XerC [Acuticoccus sp. I52.16.1]
MAPAVAADAPLGLPADPALLAIRAAWLTGLTAERGLSPNTAKAYEADTRAFLTFLAQHLGEPADLGALSALKPADVRAFLAERRRAGLSPRSMGRALAAVRTMMSHLERRHGVNAAAVRAVAAPTRPRGLPRPVPVAEALAMLESGEHWTSVRDAAVLGLLYGCGLRVGEATGLDVADVAEPLTRLRIRGKGGKERDVPVLPRVATLVDAYRRTAPFALCDGPFFRGEKGGRLSPRIVQRSVEAWRHALGLPDTATPHALRHAFATHILAHGGDLRSIQALLGHARLSTTQVYTAVDDRALLAAWRDAHPRATG